MIGTRRGRSRNVDIAQRMNVDDLLCEQDGGEEYVLGGGRGGLEKLGEIPTRSVCSSITRTHEVPPCVSILSLKERIPETGSLV